MRKLALVLAALALCAAPAAAQQSPDATTPAPAAAVVAAPAAAPQASATADPAASLYVSPTEVREQVRQADQRRARSERLESAAMGQRDFLVIAAAVAIGIILAVVVLD